MPNIEEFTAGNIDIRPQEIGVESTAAAGRRLGVYGSQIAESYTQAGRALGQVADTAEKYLEHREVNTGAAHGADLIAAKNQSWNNFITGKDIPADAPNRQDLINQRINNPQSAKQWREQSLEPDLQQFQQGFLTPGGRQWASEFTNRYRLHMAEHTAAEQSSMAGAVVQANNEKATDSFATATFNDPSALKTNLGLLNHSIDGTVQSSPTMSPVDATKVTTELKQKAGEKLVAAAIQGAILKGGNWQTIANDPAYSQYVKPAENAMFEKQAKAYARSQEIDARTTARLDKEAKKEASDEAGAQYRVEVLAQDPRLRDNPVAQRIVKDPKLLPSTRDKLLDELHRENQPETDTRISETTQTGLLKQFWSAKTPEEYKAFDDAAHAARLKAAGEPGSLNSAHYDWLMKLDRYDVTKEPEFKYAARYAQQVITDSYGGAKYDTDGKSNAFAVKFLELYNNARKAGTLPDNALDVDDEKSLIRTTMKSYIAPLGDTIINNGGAGSPPTPVYTGPAPTTAMPAVALPPVKDRVKDQIYPTARGPMQWTGTGWVPPPAAPTAPVPPILAPGQM